MVIAESYFPPWWTFLVFFGVCLAMALFVQNRGAGFFEQLLRNDLTARGIGLLVVAFGLGFAYLVAYGPLQDALSGQHMVMMNYGAVGLAALFIFYGLVMLLSGRHWPKFLFTKLTPEPTPLRRSFLLIGLALAAATIFAYHHFFHALGYTLR